MAACAHYMRIYILYLELRARQCPEPSQVIVRRSRQHPGEGYRNVMVRIHQRVPFAYFIVECPLPCEFIRIRPYQSGRLARPMELYEEPVSCRTFQYLFLDAYHLLVITVHEVHHESFYSPSLIERKGFFEFVVQRHRCMPTPLLLAYSTILGMFRHGIGFVTSALGPAHPKLKLSS